MAPSDPENARLKITWRELKQACEAAGIKDDDPIDIIEVAWGSPDELKCVKDEDFGWQITLESYR